MFYLLSPTASVLMGLFVAGYAALTGAKSAAKALLSSSDCGDCHYEKPFLELSVQPVSEGDTVRHAYKHKGKYMAWIENRRKKNRLDIEAESKEELERKVQDTFRAWAITGKKRKDWPYT